MHRCFRHAATSVRPRGCSYRTYSMLIQLRIQFLINQVFVFSSRIFVRPQTFIPKWIYKVHLLCNNQNSLALLWPAVGVCVCLCSAANLFVCLQHAHFVLIHPNFIPVFSGKYTILKYWMSFLKFLFVLHDLSCPWFRHHSQSQWTKLKSMFW